MAEMTGVVTIVQESRFQLSDDAGVSHHFVLGHAAMAETSQLRPLQTQQARIRVRYNEASGLICLIAHRLDVIEPVPG